MTYAYVLTLQFPMGGANHAVMETYGTVDVPAGTSRHELFMQIRSNVIEEVHGRGISGTPTTVFWSLERDDLGKAH